MSTERAKKLVERAGDRPLFSAEQAEIVAALSAAQQRAAQAEVRLALVETELNQCEQKALEYYGRMSAAQQRAEQAEAERAESMRHYNDAQTVLGEAFKSAEEQRNEIARGKAMSRTWQQKALAAEARIAAVEALLAKTDDDYRRVLGYTASAKVAVAAVRDALHPAVPEPAVLRSCLCGTEDGFVEHDDKCEAAPVATADKEANGE